MDDNKDTARCRPVVGRMNDIPALWERFDTASSAYSVTVVIFIGVFFMVCYKMIAAYNIVQGKQKENFFYLVVSVIGNIAANAILIPIYGNIGAAIASIFSYAISTYLFTHRFIKETGTKMSDMLLLDKGDIAHLKNQFGKIYRLSKVKEATKMKKWIIPLLLVMLFCGCQQNVNAENVELKQDGEEPFANSIIMDLLDEDLWNARDIADASHVLMMPMHYVFKNNNQVGIQKYTEFFQRFVDTPAGFSELSRLQRMQFLYLATQFMKLGGEVDGLKEIVLENASADLAAVATWKVEPTVKEHFIQVLAHKEYKYSYYSLIVDADFYTLACLCDLAYLGEKNDDISFAVKYVGELFADPLINTETGEGRYWLFQVGVGKDYKDYAYAGHEEAYEGMESLRKEDIVCDSSHFRRMPLWLISFKDAQEDSRLFEKRIMQLGNLFSEKVLQRSEGFWVTTTYIDGSNGVFRYNYHNDGNSIQGYDQSGGTLFLGYWIMLENKKIKAVYEEILEMLPLSADEENPYFDNGITVREQNPIMDRNACWSNGLMETLINCIVGIA